MKSSTHIDYSQGTYTYRSKDPWSGEWSENSDTGLGIKRYRAFATIGGETKGDFKSPTAYSYSKQHTGTYHGTYTAITPTTEHIYRGNLGQCAWFTSGYGGYGGGLDPTASELGVIAYNKATEKFYDALRMSDLNVAQDLAEYRQTSRMIGGAMKDIVSFFRKFRRSLVVKPGRTVLDAAANAWLAYNYGWKPLASTLHGLALHSPLQGGWVVIKGRATATRSSQVKLTNPNYLDEKRWESSARCTIKAIMKRPDEAVDVSRLTSMDPRVIAWELVPFSFVVDWVFDVGSYLAAIENARLYSTYAFYNGYSTRVVRTAVKARKSGVWEESGYTKTISATAESTYVNKSRSVLTSVPRPSLPVVNATKLGSFHVFTGAALIRQLMSR